MSETQTVTIADFLLARIAEDEAEARDAASRHQVEQGRGAFVCTEEGAHVGYSPAHVLADVEAKRRIVEDWQQWRDEAQAWHARYRATGQADMLEMAQRYDDLASHAERPMLRLAAVFADHSDYGPEWRP